MLSIFDLTIIIINNLFPLFIFIINNLIHCFIIFIIIFRIILITIINLGGHHISHYNLHYSIVMSISCFSQSVRVVIDCDWAELVNLY